MIATPDQIRVSVKRYIDEAQRCTYDQLVAALVDVRKGLTGGAIDRALFRLETDGDADRRAGTITSLAIRPEETT
ncbi:MAG: hypothetical protein AAGA65_23915 [Actinomycetota bacterium]